MTIGHKLALRLFLEGVEIPVISVSIQIAANAPVAASIQVIATDKILDIHPRTVVHLFFYDFAAESVDYGATAADAAGGIPSTKSDSLLLDVINEQYKLLFMGEVQALAFQKDEGSRQVVLNCVDFSNYWDTTYQYNFRGSLLGGRRHAAFIGANANFFTSPLGHGTGTIAALLNGRSVNFPNLKGLMGGIVRLLEAIGGAYYGYNTFKGANDFTSIAELRLKILQQIWAPEKDTSTAKLFAHKAFSMWMNRQSGSLGKLVTFRGLTHMLQQFIFTTIYPNPTGKYQVGETGLKKPVSWKTDLSKDPRTRPTYLAIKRVKALLISAKNNISRVPTTAANAGILSGIKKSLQTVAGGGYQSFKKGESDLWEARRSLKSIGVTTLPTAVKGVTIYVIKAAKGVDNAYKQIGSGYTTLDVRKCGNRTKNAAAQTELSRAIDACNALLGLKLTNSKTITYDKLDRVYNQILRPDLWYAPPPRCNVLFPELYSSFNWSRNFLREVTRLELQTTNEILGDDALFNGRYYAPNVLDMRKGVKLSSGKFNRLIMRHELFTGIIPMFEKIGECNLFAMKADKAKYKGAKISYAQRAVNHQYFKHRFASRQMAAGGRFNPWFICGFPGLLIDRPMDAENLGISRLAVSEQKTRLKIDEKTQVTVATLLQQLVPVQYLGSCVSLAHNVTQGGGTTSYAFGQARLHRESTEYLGVDKVTTSSKIGESTRKIVVAALEGFKPRLKGRGQFGGIITSVKNVTAKYRGRSAPLYLDKSKRKDVIIGASSKKQSGPLAEDEVGPVLALSGSPTLVHYNAYEIVETVGRYQRNNIDWPIEFAVRPPWIWDGWGNLKIGETYHEAFGVNAITDIEGFTSKETAALLTSADDNTVMLSGKEAKAYGSQDGSPIYVAKAKSNSKYDASQTKTVGKLDKESDINKKLFAEAQKTIKKERTIENSVDYLVRIYSFIGHNSLDVGTFLRNYTWRPIATMVEIMGSADFTITKTGPNTFKTAGTEGFHSRAFGDVSNLFGLVDAKVKKVLGLSKKKEKVAKNLDVRAERRKKVQAYVAELTNSKGLLG